MPIKWMAPESLSASSYESDVVGTWRQIIPLRHLTVKSFQT
jgi:hypothetical protein